jgi:hypothetical protein
LGVGVLGFKEALIDAFERLGIAMAVAFIITLASAAVFLAIGREDPANRLAEVAYYFLVTAVVAMLVVTAASPGEGGEGESGGAGKG